MFKYSTRLEKNEVNQLLKKFNKLLKEVLKYLLRNKIPENLKTVVLIKITNSLNIVRKVKIKKIKKLET